MQVEPRNSKIAQKQSFRLPDMGRNRLRLHKAMFLRPRLQLRNLPFGFRRTWLWLLDALDSNHVWKYLVNRRHVFLLITTMVSAGFCVTGRRPLTCVARLMSVTGLPDPCKQFPLPWHARIIWNYRCK